MKSWVFEVFFDDWYDNIIMEIINGWGLLEWIIEDFLVEVRFVCVMIESYKNMFYYIWVV